MGFNKRYLPPVDSLREIRGKMKDDAYFLKIYLYNPDAIIGSEDSMDYLREVEKEQLQKA